MKFSATTDARGLRPEQVTCPRCLIGQRCHHDDTFQKNKEVRDVAEEAEAVAEGGE